MAGLNRAKGFCRRQWDQNRANVIVGGLVLICAVVVGGYFLTKEKDPVVTSSVVKAENDGIDKVDSNPLKKDAYEEVNQVVQKYYARLAENTEFVDEYQDIVAYTKLGKYKDSYIVYAYYEMKIKDIYTTVPGLGTLYVDKSKGGKLQVVNDVEDTDIIKLAKTLSGHEDVQALMKQVQTNYDRAVESDAMLREALADLRKAYEDSTGKTVVEKKKTSTKAEQ